MVQVRAGRPWIVRLPNKLGSQSRGSARIQLIQQQPLGQKPFATHVEPPLEWRVRVGEASTEGHFQMGHSLGLGQSRWLDGLGGCGTAPYHPFPRRKRSLTGTNLCDNRLMSIAFSHLMDFLLKTISLSCCNGFRCSSHRLLGQSLVLGTWYA